MPEGYDAMGFSPEDHAKASQMGLDLTRFDHRQAFKAAQQGPSLKQALVPQAQNPAPPPSGGPGAGVPSQPIGMAGPGLDAQAQGMSNLFQALKNKPQGNPQ